MDPRHSYRQAAGQGASGVRLVILLYEQIIQDLGRAVKAIEENNIERRTREINHALTVIGHLQGTLDLERGGTVARNLARFYTSVRAGLVEAHARVSRQILQQQIDLPVGNAGGLDGGGPEADRRLFVQLWFDRDRLERLMPAPATQGLQVINARLRAVLADWQTTSGEPASLKTPVLADLLEDLRRAAEWLRAIPPNSPPDDELAREISEYRNHVQQLQQILPAIQARMLAEKARLESARSHLAAAAAWADGRKKIL